MKAARRAWEDLALAWMVLTRIPIPAALRPEPPPSLARGVWSYPFVGALLGAGGGLVYALAHGLLGVPPPLASGWTLAAMLVATGALHEDGLADTADGFGGGRDRPHKLAIMRDSQIGSFGVLALVLSLGLRGVAIAWVGGSGPVAAWLVASGALGRSAILGVLALAPPARPDGLAASLGGARREVIMAGLALAALLSLAVLPVWMALAATVLAAACAFGMARLARSQIGGHSGDVLGATDQLVECVVLTLAGTLAA